MVQIFSSEKKTYGKDGFITTLIAISCYSTFFYEVCILGFVTYFRMGQCE